MQNQIQDPILIFDVDSVLNQLHDSWRKLVEERTGDSIAYEDCASWNFPLGQKKYLDILYNEPGFFRTIPATPHAEVALNHLHKRGFEIIICSASHPNTVKDKEEWILKLFPWLGYRNIVYAHRKELLAAPNRILIDDGPHNITAFQAAGGRTIVFDHPWNRFDDEGLVIPGPRACDFIEVIVLINEMTSTKEVSIA